MQVVLALAVGSPEFDLHARGKHCLGTVVDADNKRLFPAKMDAAEKRLLAVLRQAIPRRIAVHLLEEPEATPATMATSAGVLPSTLNYHLMKLLGSGIVTRRRDGRQSHYTLVDPEAITRVLIAHQASLLDRIVDGFLAGLEGLRA